MEELQITNLEAIKTTSDSITIEWKVKTKIPAEKISYEAVLFGETDDKYDVSDPLQETNSYTFNNLTPNTEYSVFVRVYEEPENHLLIEYPSEGKTVKTNAILPKKPKENPKPLSVTNVSDKAFTIVWEKSNDKSIRYQAFLKEAGEPDEAWRQLTNKMNVGSTRARGLKPDTQYVFYVNLLNADDSIFRHDEGEARTHETVQKPTHYTPLKVKNATGYHLKFVWDEIRNQEVRYNAFIKESKNKEWTQIAENLTDITAITAGDLKPDTLYDFYYEILNKAGKVIRHEECSARTSDKVLKVSNITSDGFTLEWDPLTEDKAKHQATEYGVQWEGEDGSGRARNETGISSYTITGLKPGISYTARVLVFDQDFTYEIAEPIHIPFPEKEETPDKNVPILNSKALRAAYISGDNFVIYWECAKDASGKDWANRHLVFIKEEEAPDTKWRKVAEEEGRQGLQTGAAHVVHLKPGTRYVFYVEATNEAGDTLRYDQGSVKTLDFVDHKAPTVKDTTLTISDITSDGFTVKWKKAKDNVTPREKILYEAILIEAEEKDRSKWRRFAQARDIDSARATGLKPATKYKVWVNAEDEAHYTLSYPSAGNNGHIIVETLDNIVSETPSANDKALHVTRVTSFSFTVEWEKARSKNTRENAMRYLFYLKEKGSKTYQKDPVRIDGVGAYTYLFSRGGAGASYTCFLKALDAKGNSFEYDEVDVHLPSADKKYSSSPNSIVLSKPDEVYSNGVYEGLSFNYKTTALFEELGNQFKRDCFEVSFEFFILPNNIEGTRKWGWGGQDNALVSLGSNPSGLIITLTQDFRVCVMADTQQYRMAYPCITPIKFEKEVWQSFKLLYIDGDLIINDDKLLPIGKFNNFNKVITSVNFYSGSGFIGYIRNLVVKSL